MSKTEAVASFERHRRLRHKPHLVKPGTVSRTQIGKNEFILTSKPQGGMLAGDVGVPGKGDIRLVRAT